MNTRHASALAPVFLMAFTVPVRAVDQPSQNLPWAFKGSPADGYSVDLKSIRPLPGTYLRAGTSIDFKVELNYMLSATQQGNVILVFEDEKSRSLQPDGAQISQRVSSPSGSLSLSDSITVPAQATELRVYIPLVPDGTQTSTRGIIGVRYPVMHEGSTPPHPGPGFPQTSEFYPAESAKRGEEGTTTTTVRACFDTNGKLTENIQILKSSGIERIDRAASALATKGSGRYIPLHQDGHSVAGCMAFNIAF
jgi:TonB family protein